MLHFKMKNRLDYSIYQLSGYSVGGKYISRPEHPESESLGQVTRESMGQINNATQLTLLITLCEVGLYPSIPAEGRHHVSALQSFIPCYPPITFT